MIYDITKTPCHHGERKYHCYSCLIYKQTEIFDYLSGFDNINHENTHPRNPINIHRGNITIHIDIQHNGVANHSMEFDVGKKTRRSIIHIAFNTGTYHDGTRIISSCWAYNRLGQYRVDRTKRDEWQNRLQVLSNTISSIIENEQKKELQLIYLFCCTEETRESTWSYIKNNNAY